MIYNTSKSAGYFVLKTVFCTKTLVNEEGEECFTKGRIYDVIQNMSRPKLYRDSILINNEGRKT